MNVYAKVNNCNFKKSKKLTMQEAEYKQNVIATSQIITQTQFHKDFQLVRSNSFEKISM